MEDEEKTEVFNVMESLLPLNRQVRVRGLDPLMLIGGIVLIGIVIFLFHVLVLGILLAVAFAFIMAKSRKTALKKDFYFYQNMFSFGSQPKKINDESSVLNYVIRDKKDE